MEVVFAEIFGGVGGGGGVLLCYESFEMLETIQEYFKFFLGFNLPGFGIGEGLFQCCEALFLGAGGMLLHRVHS